MRLILACDPDGGIGVNNSLPWPTLHGDLERFKKLTTGCTVVMGRKTWDSLPRKPLPNRLNIVISSNKIDEVLTSPFIDILDVYPDAWIIGGATLIDACWDRITEIHLSRTVARYHCDTFIDLVKLSSFTLFSSEQFEDHTYEVWKKL